MLSGTLQPYGLWSSPCHHSAAGKHSMHCLSCQKPQLLIPVQMLSGTLQPSVHWSSPCHHSAAGKHSMHCLSCQKPQLVILIQLLSGLSAAGLSCWRLPLAFLQAPSTVILCLHMLLRPALTSMTVLELVPGVAAACLRARRSLV